jgi:hypothetical protein
LVPYCIKENRIDVPLGDYWYAQPQLFFTCHLCPRDGRLPKNQSHRTGLDDLLFNLVFFSTFEELQLPIKGPMEDAEVVKLYEPSPTPCLYVAPVENIVGSLRVPLFLLFLAGNTTPTITHIYSKLKDSGFQWAAPMQQRWMAGAAAMSMRSTSDCGSLGAESHAWVVLLFRRVQTIIF